MTLNPLDLLQAAKDHAALGASAVAVTGALWAAAKWGPGLVVKRLAAAFARLRADGTLLSPQHPKRILAYLAVLEWIEDEVPDPDPQGLNAATAAWFAAAGAWIAGHLPPLVAGTAAGWAKALRAMSDGTDAAFKAEVAFVRQVAVQLGLRAA